MNAVLIEEYELCAPELVDDLRNFGADEVYCSENLSTRVRYLFVRFPGIEFRIHPHSRLNTAWQISDDEWRAIGSPEDRYSDLASAVRKIKRIISPA